jgi:hypothetical protein
LKFYGGWLSLEKALIGKILENGLVVGLLVVLHCSVYQIR